jgi:hypothetical protein
MFNEMSRQPEEKNGLFTATRSVDHVGTRQCAVVRLSSIRMTCHLVPRYRTFEPPGPLILHSDVLQLCETFYFNIYATYFLYELIRHWSQDRRRVERGLQVRLALFSAAKSTHIVQIIRGRIVLEPRSPRRGMIQIYLSGVR